MYSCSKQNTKECNRHIFSLKPRSITCHFQQPISVNFCQKHPQKQPPSKKTPCQNFQGPTFNKDNNYLTCSFMLSSQKKKYKKNEQQNPLNNQNKYQNIYQQKSEILIPKPNTKNLHCNVCKEKYQDYLDHVGLARHRKKIQGSACMGYIRDLQGKYRRGRNSGKQVRVGKQVGGEKDKEVTITEASNCVIVIDQSKQEEEVEAMGRPNKRVKIEKNEQNNPKNTQQPKLPIPPHQYYTQYNQILHRLQTSYWQLLQLNPLAYQYMYPQIQTDPYYINPPSTFPSIFNIPHAIYPTHPTHLHHHHISSTNQIPKIGSINQNQNIPYLMPMQINGNSMYGCGGAGRE